MNTRPNLKRGSIDKAEHYARNMATRIPDLEGLFAIALPTREQVPVIKELRQLGERLGMRTTAEGIETPDQSELLSRSGCDVLQGYVFGRPGDLGDVGFPERPNQVKA